MQQKHMLNFYKTTRSDEFDTKGNKEPANDTRDTHDTQSVPHISSPVWINQINHNYSKHTKLKI